MAHDEAPMGIFNANTLKAAWISPLDGSGTLSYGAAANSYSEGADMVFGTVTGTEIGTAASQKLGFYGATPTAQLTGVAVSAAGIHAALVTLGLITA